MKLLYKVATINDIDELTKLRAEVLISANCLEIDEDMTIVKEKTYEYYKSAFANNSHYAIIVYDGDYIAGTGAISFYKVMPTFHNPSGEKAYIMNMYTRDEYRMNGVAFEVLKMLLEEAKRREILEITLETTEMGKPLYEKSGFRYMQSEMEYVY